eukprot:scaffold305989_cov28-Tisochrysis_lutea.AAC.3
MAPPGAGATRRAFWRRRMGKNRREGGSNESKPHRTCTSLKRAQDLGVRECTCESEWVRSCVRGKSITKMNVG